MDNNTGKIRQELERRLSLTFHERKTKEGHIVLHINFPRVYDYVDYIENNPILYQLILEEAERRHEYAMWQSEKELNLCETTPEPPEGTDIHLNQIANYGRLCRTVYEHIDELNYGYADPWGLAFTLTPWQILTYKAPFRDKLEIIRYRIKRGSSDFQKQTKEYIQGVHYRLMNLLAEYETRPESEKTPSPETAKAEQPSEAVTKLGLTPDSKWEDITITFKDDYLVKIIYQKKELEVRHEAMGFGDKRKTDVLKARDSWLLLQLLATQNGRFELNRVTGKNRIKRQKQKQELTKLLKQYFQITDDPFYETDKDNPEYKIKIQLIPDPEFRMQWRDRDIYDTSNVSKRAYLINFKDDENSSL